MKVLNKQQIQIIMLLNALLLTLICSVIFIYGGFIKPSATTDAPPKTHNIIRAARNSAHPNISYETNIGGAKAEKLVDAFFLHNKIYVFANSESSDFDLVGEAKKSFCATLSPSGNTIAFVKFDFCLTKVLPIENGFVACGNDENNGVIALFNTDLVLLKKASLAVKQTIIDLFIYDNSFFTVGAFYKTEPNLSSVIVSIFDPSLNLIAEKCALSPFSVKYIALLPYKNNRFILATNITSATNSYMSLYTLSRSDDIVPHDIKMQAPYTASGFTPTSSGYASLIPKLCGYELIAISNELKLSSSHYYNNADVSLSAMARLLSTGGAPLVYIKDLFCAHQYSADLSSYKQIPLKLGEISAVASSAKANFFLGENTTSDAFCLQSSSFSGQITKISFATYSDSAKIIPMSDGLLIIAEQSIKSADVAENFGETDIWISKLHF